MQIKLLVACIVLKRKQFTFDVMIVILFIAILHIYNKQVIIFISMLKPQQQSQQRQCWG